MPKAKVDRLSKNVPCPIKNVNIRFLPFIFNRMVCRYWKDQAKQKPDTPGHPPASDKIKVRPFVNPVRIEKKDDVHYSGVCDVKGDSIL